MIWKKLKGYDYLISNNGDIKNMKTQKLVKGTIKGGYNMVKLYSNDKNNYKDKSFRRHIIIAKLFCRKENESYCVVNHVDGNKLNNCAKNLEWISARMNTQHAEKLGLLNPTNQRKIKRVCKKSGEEKYYNSIIEACNDVTNNNVTVIDICNTCTGKQKSARGFYWFYVEDNIIDDIPINGLEIENFENYLITPEGKIYSKTVKRYLTFIPHFTVDLRSFENTDVFSNCF